MQLDFVQSFYSQIPRFLFHISPLKHSHLLKTKPLGQKGSFPFFANQAEAGVGAMLPGSSALGISHSSINVTFQ